MKDVLWMARGADIIEDLDQSVLIVWLERNVKVDCGVQRRTAEDLPVLWDGVPGVLGALVVPNWREGLCKAVEKDSGEDREYINTVVAHGFRKRRGRRVEHNEDENKARGSLPCIHVGAFMGAYLSGSF